MGRRGKVEISGVNTAKLPVLSREEAKELFLQARAGSQEAREKLIQGNLNQNPPSKTTQKSLWFGGPTAL